MQNTVHYISVFTGIYILTTKQILASLHFNENVHRDMKREEKWGNTDTCLVAKIQGWGSYR